MFQFRRMECYKMGRLIFVLCGILTFTEVSCQTPSSNQATPESRPETGLHAKDSLEDTVFNEMLRIVDHKFDSLSDRISVLERSINSLNFYSVRQFRDITESIETSTKTTEELQNQVREMDADDRALKAVVSQVSRDINNIKHGIDVVNVDVEVVKNDVKEMQSTMAEFRTNSDRMLDDIANSIVYFNENSKKKTEEVKTFVQETMSVEMFRANDQRQKSTALIVRYLEDLAPQAPPPPTNCSLDLRPIEDQIDRRFTELKRMTETQYMDLLKMEQFPQSEGRDRLHDGQLVNNSQPSGVQRPQAGEKGRERPRAVPVGARDESTPKDGEKVMRMLANMTQNVLEAVAYFRSTGGMIERLMATSEGIATEQAQLRYDVLEASGLLTQEGDDDDDDGDKDGVGRLSDEEFQANNMSEFAHIETPSREHDGQKLSRQAAYTRAGRAQPRTIGARGKLVRRPRMDINRLEPFPSNSSWARAQWVESKTEESLKVLTELAKNGTLLLDVMTDLAQLSSTSLTKAVGALHQEVVRLEDVRARLNEGLLFPGKSSAHGVTGQASSGGPCAGGDFSSLQNTTKTIFTIVEAIASNTGWIPYIFHNMQQVERLTNRTLELAKRSLLSMHWNHQDGKDLSDSDSDRPGQGNGHNFLTQVRALDFIYDTNVKFQRIMPALTRLLSEPEPLIALAGGSYSDEGRVEMFFKGRWGSVCRNAMGHNEASVVCRHLGYSGGIWAGDNDVQGGAGRLWQLNMTCLESHLCPFIVNANSSSDCSGGPFTVICDHMLRITPIAEQDRDFTTGMLTMHHHGRWLPICGHTWSGYEARVACKQMGFQDGRELEKLDDQRWNSETLGNVTTWVSGISCSGEEIRLDACEVATYQAEECFDNNGPAGVRCQ